MKSILFLIMGIVFISSGALAEVKKQDVVVMALERGIENCGFFVYPESKDRHDLILMTDELGEDVTRAWVNMGNGDLELKKVSYQEDEKGISFVFKGDRIQVSFKGLITIPASETQEFHALEGLLSVTHGSNKKDFKVVARSGC